MTVERYEKSQSLIIKKKDSDLDPDLLNFISADGIVRFRTIIHKYGESIVRQVIFQRGRKVIAFFILILSLFRCLFKVILPVR
jgi:hypothetical protein